MSVTPYAYTRFSHEDSTVKSIEDQSSAIHRYASKIGVSLIGDYSDHAISGASILIRPSLMGLLQDLASSDIKMLIVDHLDRLTRDEGDMSIIFKHLTFYKIELHSVAHGKFERNTASIMAIVGRNQLESTAHSVKRGQHGQISAGKSAGGRPFGYKLTGDAGELAIDNGEGLKLGEAAIVRRIFRERLEGKTPREIAGRLNADSIPAPLGLRWNASTLNGSRDRRNGILRNPIYMGLREWNRVSMVRSPHSGKRVSRANKTEDIVTKDVPQLAIIDLDPFNKVQALFPQDNREHPSKYRRAKTLFSGLLRCGCCNGGMSMKDQSKGRIRVQCSVMKESRSCTNTSAYYLDEIVEATLDGLKEQLNRTEVLSEMIKAYNSERSRLAAETSEKTRILDKQISDLKLNESRLWADYNDGKFEAGLANERLMIIRGGLKDLEGKKQALPPLPQSVALHPSTVKKFAAFIEDMTSMYSIQITEENRDAAEAIRKLVDEIVITPEQFGTHVEIKGLVGLLVDATKSNIRAPELGGIVVAGEGLEPPTRGL